MELIVYVTVPQIVEEIVKVPSPAATAEAVCGCPCASVHGENREGVSPAATAEAICGCPYASVHGENRERALSSSHR